MQKILNEIEQERHRQDRKWGIQKHAPTKWVAILTEEVGEVAEMSLEAEWAKETSTRDVKLMFMRNELVQVAAVAVANIQHIDSLLDNPGSE